MESTLTRRLVVITGKGGVGKTTVSAALGLLAARLGLRAIVVEMSGRQLLPGLLGTPELQRAEQHHELQLAHGLWSTTIDRDRALLEWMGELGGALPARLLASRASFRCFAAAAPGAAELLSLVKIWELTQEQRWKRHGERYDIVIVDAPATGHALGMLRSPATFGAIARIGPLASQARQVQELLDDPARSAYLAVTHASEMAVTETLELADGLQRELGRGLDRVIVNGKFSQRFTHDELGVLANLNGSPVVHSATRAARFVQDRARFQHNQIERLRRRRLPVLGIPFIFQPRLERSALEQIAERLARG
jgi:anion-transporting  ArsA/GET3 family ATPase